MSSPSGPRFGSAPSPDPRPDTGSGRPVSVAGYWIGSAVIVLGIAGAVVWFVLSIVALARTPSDYERFAVPSRTVTTLDAGSFDVYFERPGISGYGAYVNQPTVVVEDSSGSSVSIGVPLRTSTYKVGSHEGRLIGSFTITRAGAYTVTVRGEPDSSARIAFGHGLEFGDVAGLVGASALGAISLLAGILLLVVTAVRRSRARRLTGSGAGFPGPGAGPPGGPAPPPGAWSGPRPPPPPPRPTWGVSPPGADWGPPTPGAFPPPGSGWSAPGSDGPDRPGPSGPPGGAR